MATITQQHIHLLENKVRCTGCKKTLFEGVIELGAVCITCPKCGNELTIVSLHPERKTVAPGSLIDRLRQIFYR